MEHENVCFEHIQIFLWSVVYDNSYYNYELEHTYVRVDVKTETKQLVSRYSLHLIRI